MMILMWNSQLVWRYHISLILNLQLYTKILKDFLRRESHLDVFMCGRKGETYESEL